MPVKNYGVLVGRVVESRPEGGNDSPHFQIQVEGGDSQFRVAVNVLSQQSPSELLFVALEAFQHPILTALPALPEGFTPLASRPGGSALDYIRGNLFDRSAMRPMPATAPGPDNDLADRLGHFLTRAATDRTARLYAFGARWGPEAVVDLVFGFRPGNGVHDIHMNQGNAGQFTRDDGVWQDGGLLLHFGSNDQWVAIFLAFQSQAWHNDDETGHVLAEKQEAGPRTEAEGPDHTLRIIGALVNPVGPAPEKEFVTLINPGTHNIDLAGWVLMDRLKRQLVLEHALLPAGETIRIPVQAPVQLGNSGGLITLLDPDGLKVDGVAYTRDEAGHEGATLVF